MDDWKQLIGDGLIIIENQTDVPRVIAETIIKHQSEITSTPTVVKKTKVEESNNETNIIL